MSKSGRCGDSKQASSVIDDTLAKLVSVTKEVLAVLSAEDFDSDALDNLQVARNELYATLRSQVEECVVPASPLKGHPLAAELLQLEQQARKLAADQQAKASDGMRDIKQQRRIARAYAVQPETSGHLYDKKGF